MFRTEETSVHFQNTLDLLQDLADPLSNLTDELLESLSDLDLSSEHLKAFQAVWAKLPDERRHDLIQHLVIYFETSFDLNFSAIIYPALDDPHPDVRQTALAGIHEDSPPPIIRHLIHLAQHDPFSTVRTTVVATLGQFVLQGELGQLSAPLNTQLQDFLLSLYNNWNEDLDLRRHALEAIANCGREEVASLIHEAYHSDDFPMQVSAVLAMGHSCDEVWSSTVIDELTHDQPEMRLAAVHAAGELEIHSALPRLIELAYEDDREIQETAIWSLGEIGGQPANLALIELAALAEEIDDTEFAETIAAAQAAAMLSGGDPLTFFDGFSDLDDDGFDDGDLL